MALQKRAVKIILCHNHPSGELKPSKEDQDITDRLIQVGRIVNLPVLDHLIISDISYLSFKDVGLMAELEKSIKYVPSYEIAERIKAEAAAIVEQRVEETKMKIALALKNSGMQITEIAEYTGLTVQEVEGL